MGIEETHLDVLQNIEFAIVRVFREHPGLQDRAVMNALDALIASYRAELRGHSPKEATLERDERMVHDRVAAVCEWRMGREKDSRDIPRIPFTPTSLDDLVSCLRKIRKSVERWNSELGSRGYLGFVSRYV